MHGINKINMIMLNREIVYGFAYINKSFAKVFTAVTGVSVPSFYLHRYHSML